MRFAMERTEVLERFTSLHILTAPSRYSFLVIIIHLWQILSRP